MATPIQLELLLDPLSPEQKLGLMGQSLILGVGDNLRIMMSVPIGSLTITQDEPPPVQRYDDGTPFIPVAPPRPLTWEIQYGGAHGQVITAAIETLYSSFRLLSFQGSPAVTRFWDYSQPTIADAYTEFNVALIGFEPPQDVILGPTSRYLNGGSITLREIT